LRIGFGRLAAMKVIRTKVAKKTAAKRPVKNIAKAPEAVAQ
jgi:hypothetical protein